MKLTFASYAKAADFTCLGAWTLLTGPEQQFKREALARMRAEVTATAGPGTEATWETLEGSGITARDLLGRSQTLGLFGGARGIVVLQAERTDRTQQEDLAKAVGPLPAEVAIILVAGEGDDRRGRTVRAPLVKAIESHGLVIDCPALKAPEAIAWAVARAKELGKKLEPAAASLLAGQRVGTGLGELSTELEKLAVYVGEAKAITAADVEVVTPRLIEESVFKLVDAVATQHPAEAVALLRTLLRDQREEPERLLPLLAQAIREIWQVKLLVERGWRPGQPVDDDTKAMLPQDERKNALRALSGKRSFLATKRMGHAKAFSWARLARALQALASCDQAMKGITERIEDKEVALELLVVQLCTDLSMPVWG
jgi:DNA polymerase-3 subunit delta